MPETAPMSSSSPNANHVSLATTRIPQASGTLRAKGARCATRESPAAMGGCARHAVMHMKAFAARAQMVLQLPQIIRHASHARPDTRAIPKACSLALRADTQPWEQPDAPSVLLGALATRQVSSTLAAPGAAAWVSSARKAPKHQRTKRANLLPVSACQERRNRGGSSFARAIFLLASPVAAASGATWTNCPVRKAISVPTEKSVCVRRAPTAVVKCRLRAFYAEAGLRFARKDRQRPSA